MFCSDAHLVGLQTTKLKFQACVFCFSEFFLSVSLKPTHKVTYTGRKNVKGKRGSIPVHATKLYEVSAVVQLHAPIALFLEKNPPIALKNRVGV